MARPSHETLPTGEQRSSSTEQTSSAVGQSALYGHVGQSNYAAAKGGVLALTRALSIELRRHRIRVNAVAPIVRTEMIDPLFEILGGKIVESLFGAPEDVAPVFAFLASDAAVGIKRSSAFFRRDPTIRLVAPRTNKQRSWRRPVVAG